MSGDRPDARELVEAVAQWLAQELAPQLEAGPRFQAMVAAQGLAIAARELALEQEHTRADGAAFAPLVPGVAGDDPEELRRALSASIAAGDCDGNLPALALVLREHVRRKLAVARPGYDAT
jgi:Domain of unknown function (DUF6285)